MGGRNFGASTVMLGSREAADWGALWDTSGNRIGAAFGSATVCGPMFGASQEVALQRYLQHREADKCR